MKILSFTCVPHQLKYPRPHYYRAASYSPRKATSSSGLSGSLVQTESYCRLLFWCLKNLNSLQRRTVDRGTGAVSPRWEALGGVPSLGCLLMLLYLYLFYVVKVLH